MILKRIKFKEVQELRGADNSLNESVEASLKTFDISFIKLQLEYIKITDKSLEATIQVLHDKGFSKALKLSRITSPLIRDE